MSSSTWYYRALQTAFGFIPDSNNTINENSGDAQNSTVNNTLRDQIFNESLLLYIYSFYGPPKTVITELSPVSKLWRKIISSDAFYLNACLYNALQCGETNENNSREKLKKLRINNFKALYHVYFQELIKAGNQNCSIRDACRYFIISHNRMIKIESPPVGCNHQVEWCWVSSHDWASIKQTIDFNNEICESMKIIPLSLLYIELSFWFASRFDQSTMFNTKIYFNNSHLSDRRYSSLEDPYHNPHGNGWKKWIERIPLTSTNIKRIIFMWEGKDTNWWQGHFGAKIANISLVLKVGEIDINNKHEIVDIPNEN